MHSEDHTAHTTRRPSITRYFDRTVYVLAWIAGAIMVIAALVNWEIPITTAMKQYPRVATLFVGILLLAASPDAYRYTKIIYGNGDNNE